MEASVIFKTFLDELHTAFPDIVVLHEIDIETTVQTIETEFFPEVMRIIQKDSTFFTEKTRSLMNVNLSSLWTLDTTTDTTREVIWKHLHLCLFASFLHGDIKEKIGTIMSTFKGLWKGKDDEISRILNDENSEGHIKALIDYVSGTRLAKLFMDVVEQLDVSEFELNFSNPTELIDVLKNTEHPTMKKIVSKIQGLLQQKLQSGAITQAQIQSEVEGIKARIQSTFGNVFNEALGGSSGSSGVSSSVLLGNSPEARRQRMLARLQKRQMSKK